MIFPDGAVKETSANGTIEHTAQILVQWARTAPRGLGRVIYPDEFTRKAAIEQLKTVCGENGVEFHAIELPVFRPSIEIVRFLRERLADIPSGLVSVSGFPTAFAEEETLPVSLYTINLNRERIALFPVCQVWWMRPDFDAAFIQGAYDTHTWFIVTAQITESVAPSVVRSEEPVEARPTSVDVEGVRRYVDDQISRVRRSLNPETPFDIVLSVVIDAAKSLIDAGLVQESKVLLETMQGELVHIYGEQLDADTLAVMLFNWELQLPSDQKVDAARIMHNLGAVYTSQGSYAEAELLNKQALAIQLKLLPEQHPDIARSLHNLAVVYYCQGRFHEAGLLFFRALEIRRATLGERHPEIAENLNYLSAVLRRQRQYQEAEQFSRQALAIRRAHLPKDHPDVARSLNDLAELYNSQGRSHESEPLYKQSLAIERSGFPEIHPRIAWSLNGLAESYHGQERYREAESLMMQALDIRRASLPEEHPDIARSLNSLAMLYHEQGRYQEAEPLYREALRLFSRAFTEHSETERVRQHYAELLDAQNRYEEAKALREHGIIPGDRQRVI